MDLTSVGGELVEESKKQLFWAFRFYQQFCGQVS